MSGLLAPTVVLLYHRVAAGGRDTHHLRVRPERFATQIDLLRRRERIVPLAAARRMSRRRRVAITFDDGYADNAHDARQILEANGAPATYFVTTRLVDGELSPWWDELERLVFDGQPDGRWIHVHVAGRSMTADVGSEQARARAHTALHRRLRRLRRDEIDDVLDQLRAQVVVTASAPADHRFMTSAELRDVASSPLIDIGAHGVTHQQLSILPAEDQRAEIGGGRACLGALAGVTVTSFAYPYGGADAFDATSVRLVREAGYDLACAGTSGLVRPNTPRFRLPRMVVGDWDGDEFSARLERWFRGRGSA